MRSSGGAPARTAGLLAVGALPGRVPAALLLALLVAGSQAALAAQAAQPAPDEGPSFYLGTGVHRLSGEVAPRWELSRLWTVGAEARVGPGRLFVEGDHGRFERVDGSTEVSLLNGTAGLLFGWAGQGAGRFEAGPVVGVQKVLSDDLSTGSETELVLGARALVGTTLWRGLSAALVGDVQRAFYREPLDLARLSLRLGWTPPLPGKLREAVAGQGAAPRERSQPTDAGAGSFTTLSREELATAVAVGWEEVVSLLPGWSSAAPNASASRLAPPGGAHPGAAEWRVVVDGIELPVHALGEAALDRLPLPVARIDSVRVHDGPGLLDGRPTTGGVLELFVADARTLGGGVAREGGNPRGDPGLGFFDEGGNVDRQGQSSATWIGWGGVSGGVSVATGYHDRYLRARSRLSNVRRRHSTEPLKPSVEVERLSGTAWARVGPMEHRVRWGRVRGRDFLYVDPLARELLTDHAQDWGGVGGRVGLDPGRALRYGASWSRRELGSLPNDTTAALLGFREDLVEGWATLELGRWSVGAVGTRRQAASERSLRDSTQGEGRIRVAAELGGVEVGAGAGRAGGISVGDLLLERRTRLADGVELRLAGQVERTPLAEEGSLWSWERRGLGLLAAHGVVADPGEEGAAWRGRAEARLGGSAGGTGLRWRAGVHLGRDARLAEDVSDSGDPDGAGAAALTRREVSGAWAGGWIESRLGGPRLHASLRLDHTLGAWGDDGWTELRDRVPDVQLRSATVWRMAPDLSLRAELRARSSTTWRGRWSEEGAPVVLPASLTVDVAARKTFWGGRVWLATRVADLLDQEKASHPLGIPPVLRINVEGGVRVGGG